MVNFRLTDNMNPRNAARVIDHLRAERLWVPSTEDYGSKHGEWLERTEARLIDGTAHALLASFGRVAAGAVIFRPEPDNATIIGIRNISINPAYEGRYVGAFTLRNAECAAREAYPETSQIIVDTKTTNHAMIAFLESQDYTPEAIIDLYQSGKPDIILSKLLRPQDAAAAPQPSDDHSTR
jgi:hypothetical protein